MNTETLPQTKSCPLCGEPLPLNATECTKCDWVVDYGHQNEIHLPRNPRDFAAGAMSIMMPGAGHIFKGHPIVGWMLMLLGIPVVAVFAFAFTMFFGWLLLPTYWLAVAADAYFREDLRLDPASFRPAHAH